ncbi:MAG: hypothetical protein M1376_15890 [Planctomycetes bacterium]|nr:hypothetical protein [Planctomycetota bacterium]
MILWSSKELEQALARGQLDSWTKVKYLMVPAVLGSLSIPFYVFRPIYGQKPPAINSLFSLVFYIVAVYLNYWGLKKCFVANRDIDGQAFFERTALLGVPILVRVIAVVTLTSVALLIVIGNLKDRVPMLFHRAGILFSAFTPITTFVMYAMLTNSIRRFGRLVKAKESAGS